ncbi:MAG: hypothetical protein M3R11_04065 [Acidobacteriota bacterium]|nr:hypothetical protein [Acidobacteriota bacterium]
MSFKSNFFRVIGALCLVFSITIMAFADTIRLKDGSIIKGKIVSFGNGKFVVMVGSRQINFSALEIESITFDADSMPTTNTKNSIGISNNTDNSNNNSTIITVGQNSKTTDTQTAQTPVPPVATNQNNSEKVPKPVEIGVKVLADNTANGWTNSGWVVRKGQRIRISGTGRISLGGGRFAAPGGIASLPDKGKLMAQESTGGLIAVIGDNNNDFIFVGDAKEFIAPRDGALFLGINEGNLDDNSGLFDVKIEISPEAS